MRKKKRPPGSARALVDCSPHRTTGGGFFEGLTGVDAEYESTNESNALYTLVLCHDVVKIASQSVNDEYEFEGKIHRYTPDFVVDAFVPSLRIEVKALSHMAKNSTSWDKYVAIAAAYREKGIAYGVLVDAQLEQEPRFSSVKLLKRYVTSKVSQAVLDRALTSLVNGPLPLSELRTQAFLELVDVWTLIARRHLCFDWREPLNPQTTMVSLPDQPYGGLKLEDVLCSTRYGGFLAALALGRRPTDKCLLADAATWRRRDFPLEPWAFVGGFRRAAPVRHLGEEEQFPRNPRRRRNFALGGRAVPPRDSN